MHSAVMKTEFGQRMTAARKRKKLTQQQVCKAIGIAQSTLSELENSANGSQYTAELARLYGVDPIYLAKGETESELPAKMREPKTALPERMSTGMQNPPTQALAWELLGDYMRSPRPNELKEQPPPYHSKRWFIVTSDEMTPSINPGDEVLADPSLPLKPGAIILCEDDTGAWHIRAVQDVGRGEWIAVASNSTAYGPISPDMLRTVCRVSRVSKPV
jgi:transcriptional regulator with XRE-family HTH domain